MLTWENGLKIKQGKGRINIRPSVLNAITLESSPEEALKCLGRRKGGQMD